MKYSNKQILDSLLNSAGSTAADMTSQLKLYILMRKSVLYLRSP